MTDAEAHLSTLKNQFGEKLLEVEVSEPTRLRLRVQSTDLLEIMRFIEAEMGFTSLESISGVDWETYFEIVYHIDRWDGDPTVIQVSIHIEDRENPVFPSVTSIWRSADWHEREVFDLFGINVDGHPNLRRLLLPEEWDEYDHVDMTALYPFRRDYKLPEKPFQYKPRPPTEESS
ncbi:MAG: NADH-quinone oxidoreductase subunit C [Candidatus Thorarchaeota archaeon]